MLTASAIAFSSVITDVAINWQRNIIQHLSKGYLSISLLPPLKLNTILGKVKEALEVNNRNYDLVIKRLYLYYDMKLVTFGIDDQRNLIIQSSLCPPTHPATSDILPNGNGSISNCR